MCSPLPTPAGTNAAAKVPRRLGASGRSGSDGLGTDYEDRFEECVVCMDLPVQITLYPCKHNITCAR